MTDVRTTPESTPSADWCEAPHAESPDNVVAVGDRLGE
jgi:hypothetical protein